MFTTTRHIYIASASPRRHELLKSVELPFSIMRLENVEPEPDSGETPVNFVQRSAAAKGEVALHYATALGYSNFLLIAADTIVHQNMIIMGKPKTETDALHMLKRLSGKCHDVTTAVYLAWDYKGDILKDDFIDTTSVTFYHWMDPILKDYIHTGEPMDKAGAYAIQGKGAFLVKSITGSWTNVMGLPLSLVLKKLLSHKLLHVS